MPSVNLNHYDNEGYQPGNILKWALWYLINLLFFNTFFPVPSVFKAKLLRLFGAKLGIGIVIKPCVNIKFPWFLEIGDYSWVGEGVSIDNQAKVIIGKNVVLSQGAYLLTGNHNYKKMTFDLMVGEIILEDGVWIGAKAIVCPGVKCDSHSVLTVGSVATKNLEPYHIYQGNPAQYIRKRIIER